MSGDRKLAVFLEDSLERVIRRDYSLTPAYAASIVDNFYSLADYKKSRTFMRVVISLLWELPFKGHLENTPGRQAVVREFQTSLSYFVAAITNHFNFSVGQVSALNQSQVSTSTQVPISLQETISSHGNQIKLEHLQALVQQVIDLCEIITDILSKDVKDKTLQELFIKTIFLFLGKEDGPDLISRYVRPRLFPEEYTGNYFQAVLDSTLESDGSMNFSVLEYCLSFFPERIRMRMADIIAKWAENKAITNTGFTLEQRTEVSRRVEVFLKQKTRLTTTSTLVLSPVITEASISMAASTESVRSSPRSDFCLPSPVPAVMEGSTGSVGGSCAMAGGHAHPLRPTPPLHPGLAVAVFHHHSAVSGGVDKPPRRPAVMVGGGPMASVPHLSGSPAPAAPTKM